MYVAIFGFSENSAASAYRVPSTADFTYDIWALMAVCRDPVGVGGKGKRGIGEREDCPSVHGPVAVLMPAGNPHPHFCPSGRDFHEFDAGFLGPGIAGKERVGGFPG